MSELGLRVLERVHGHLGVLTAAALAHPAIILRTRGRRAHLSVALGVGFPLVTGALGALLYDPYRTHLKQGIFIDARTFGNLFERKEHVAFAAIALAICGAAAYARSRGKQADPRFARASHLAFALAFGLALVTAILGTAVASFRSF